MIRKNKSVSEQLRAMKIGESIIVNARSGISPKTLNSTAGRLHKEGYDFTTSIVGLPKGACRVTRIEPRPRTERVVRVAPDKIIVQKAVPGAEVSSTKEIATTFEIDYLEDGTPSHISLPVTYDQYKYWRKRNEISEDAGNSYLAKLI